MADVLIQGAGIAGCALAVMLRKQGHAVTVVERGSSPRQGGQAVDVRGAALNVGERIGLIEEVRACRTSFRGMSVCNERGEEIERTTERTLSGGRLDSADVELFRDDLSRILFDAADAGVTYMFGDQVASLHQQGRQVDVGFDGGGRRSFDLLTKIIGGFMRNQIETAVADRYPLAWDFIRGRDVFGGPLPPHLLSSTGMQRQNGIRERTMSLLRRYVFDYFGRK